MLLGMGGYGSGRHYGRPTVDASKRIDLARMFREGMVREGSNLQGTLRWSSGGSPRGSIGYVAMMREAGSEWLELSYTRDSDGQPEDVSQTIQLCSTVPNYGGKRWWMICPFKHVRVGKLYLPNGGDRFATRQAWRLGYHSQRLAA